ncbi:hypothetical protein AB0N16_09105 [Streptomyces sp. NPDC051105]|uniref:hypothetical protein n=1 Tax=Streptomyces sp. NPDC051105 TaxID=3154843 RepID=UPI00342B73A4
MTARRCRALLRESAGAPSVIAFGGTGSVTAGELNAAGSSISASGNDAVLRPYFNGVASAARTVAPRTDSGEPAAAESGRATDRNPASLRTARRR